MSRDNPYKIDRATCLGRNATSHMKDCYDEGYIRALSDYGIWKDGTQVIGCMETPLREIIDFIKKLDNTE